MKHLSRLLWHRAYRGPVSVLPRRSGLARECSGACNGKRPEILARRPGLFAGKPAPTGGRQMLDIEQDSCTYNGLWRITEMCPTTD